MKIAVLESGQAMKIPDAEAAVDQEQEKHENLPAWQITEVKSKREVSSKRHRKNK